MLGCKVDKMGKGTGVTSPRCYTRAPLVEVAEGPRGGGLEGGFQEGAMGGVGGGGLGGGRGPGGAIWGGGVGGGGGGGIGSPYLPLPSI